MLDLINLKCELSVMEYKTFTILVCLYLLAAQALAQRNRPRPTPATTESPTDSADSDKCQANLLVGRDGRDGQAGPVGPPGVPGAPGESGVDVDTLTETVRLIANGELKNISAAISDPMNIVIKYDKVCTEDESTTTPIPVSVSGRNVHQSRPTPPTSEPVCQAPRNASCPLGLTYTDAAESCYKILQCNRYLASGWYWLKFRHRPNLNLALVRVYCHMEDDICGVGGLTRIAFLDVNNTRPHCPYPLQLITVSGHKMCVTNRGGALFSPVFFDTFHLQYNFVCGRAVGYSYYSNPYAFYYSSSGTNAYKTLDTSYVDGLSITYKVKDQRRHIWSLAGGHKDPGNSNAYNCPCASGASYNTPYFVGDDYYCDTGANSHSAKWYLSNPLWNGQGCHSSSRCCDNKRLPWFWRTLPHDVSSDIEVRWMRPTNSNNHNYGISLLELYVR